MDIDNQFICTRCKKDEKQLRDEAKVRNDLPIGAEVRCISGLREDHNFVRKNVYEMTELLDKAENASYIIRAGIGRAGCSIPQSEIDSALEVFHTVYKAGLKLRETNDI